MTYYQITEILYETLTDSRVDFTTITHGSIEDVDLARQTIFPLAHITPSTATLADKTISFSMNVAALDIVDYNKNDLRDETNPFYGTDNKIDVLSDLITRLQIAVDIIRRKLADRNVAIETSITNTPFVDRFENLLAGWETTLTIIVPNSAVNQGAC